MPQNFIERYTLMPTWLNDLVNILERIWPLLTVIPGLLALRETRAQKASANKEEAQGADQIVKSSMTLIKHHEEDTKRFREMADHYEKIAEHLKVSFDGCKEKMEELSEKVGCIEESNEKLRLENAELLQRNINLMREVESLKQIVTELVQQLKEHNLEPRFGKRNEDSLVEGVK